MSDATQLMRDLLTATDARTEEWLKIWRPNLARSTGVVPGRQLPLGGPDGSGYPAIDHAASHESGGADEIDLGSLAGSIIIGQIPDSLITIAKLAFDPATQSELDAHTGTVAGASVLGHVKVGAGLSIDGGGVLSATGAPPTGAAGGVLGGTYPNPSFAADMATQAELDAHATLTTGAHGGIVASSDSRLSDARAPTGAAGGVLGGTYPNPSFAADMATQAELDTHAALTTSAHGGIVASSDSRLSDARTPTAHATSHHSGGSDALALGSIAGSLALGQVPDALITYAKLQNVSATDKLLGRATAGAGVVEEIALTAAGRALIDDADNAAQRTTLGLGAAALLGTPIPLASGGTHADLSATGGAGQYLKQASAGANITVGAVAYSELTGIPSTFAPSTHASSHHSGGSDALALGSIAGSLALGQIPASLITYAKIQNVSATDKLLGRATAGAGVIEEIALTAAGRALIDDADNAAQRTTLGLGAAALIGTPVSSANGGTGVDNGGRTLTINTNSGTVAFAGAGSTATVPAAGGTIAMIGVANVFTQPQLVGVGGTTAGTNTGFKSLYISTDDTVISVAATAECDSTIVAGQTALQPIAVNSVVRVRGSANNTDAKGARCYDGSIFVTHTGTVTNVGAFRLDARNNGAGTVTNLYGAWVTAMTNDGGGVITNTYGFKVDALAVGTNRYAFYGNNASGTNIYNAYMAGTAANYFAGAVQLGNLLEMTEITAPGAPPANGAYLYLDDNGAGKTRLMCRFNTGAVQQLAIQP